ncbi:piggyBac transposable element-derived protein 2-like [Portunus trituberculatus]|uniref:piggyBac transposable element-derived protein 2-like n=1 Tax=Portunus trituberculatus TaxID=210409 RepID=UPI001E1CB6A8|nr:piggyBac transposable element-derived protein 2-like [Portunus trituberculatus]
MAQPSTSGGINPTNFYGDSLPPRPRYMDYTCRDEPRSDSEYSDIEDVEDSGDEYLLTQDDEAQFRRDLMLDFQDEKAVVAGRSRRRTLLPLDPVALPSDAPAANGTTQETLAHVAYAKQNKDTSDLDCDTLSNNISVHGHGNSSDVTVTTPSVAHVSEVERDEEVEDYRNLKHKINWKQCDPNENNEKNIPEFRGFVSGRENALQPIEYFRQFFDRELLTLICNESNRYALQCDPSKPLSLTVQELEVFLGICIYMSIVKMTSHRRYWTSDAHLRAVIDYMSCARWERIKSCIHFADNSQCPAKGTPEYDKLYKVKPLLNHLKSKYNMIPMDKNVCVDEQMIPYKGTRGPRYYIKGKPNPWGFKVWTLAGSHGIVHNFEVCVGATPKVDGFPDLKSSANIVCKLASIIPTHKNYRLYMDNLFSTIPLYFEMYKRGILCMGTVRTNRLSGLRMIPDKDLKAKGKSAFVEYDGKVETCPESVRVVRWNDSNLCTIMSTMGSAQPVANIPRWDKSVSTTEKSPVNCPALIKHYNENMGGVDKMDALIGFYRMFFRSKKWYHRIFFHFADLSICNAWLLYRRDIQALDARAKYLSLHDFKLVLSSCLRMQDKPLSGKRRGRPSSASVDERLVEKKQKGHNTKPIPPKPVREDQIGHFPINVPKRGRCKKPILQIISCNMVPKVPSIPLQHHQAGYAGFPPQAASLSGNVLHIASQTSPCLRAQSRPRALAKTGLGLKYSSPIDQPMDKSEQSGCQCF